MKRTLTALSTSSLRKSRSSHPSLSQKSKSKPLKTSMSFQTTLARFLRSSSHRSKSELIRQILGEATTSYDVIAQSVTLDSLVALANTIFIEKPQRITVELFAKEIKSDEKAFKAYPDKETSINAYEIAELQQILDKQ